MTSREDALVEVVDIIKRHGLTLEEVYAGLQGSAEFKAQKSGSILMRVFGYLGGLFVFAGLSAFVGMEWSGMSPFSHICATLGIGFCVFIMAVTCATQGKLPYAATPLFLIAALLQPLGIGVLMMELSRGGDPALGALFVLFVMALQQGCTFWALDLTVLALTSLIFTGSFVGVALDLMQVPPDLTGIVLGLSLSCIGWSLDQSKHKALAWVCYLFGSALVLCVAGDVLKGTPFEILFLGLSIAVIFLSTVARSKTLLVVGTCALLGYVSYFMDKYFHDSLAGPLGFILAGLMLIGVGVAVVKINNKFIKQKG